MLYCSFGKSLTTALQGSFRVELDWLCNIMYTVFCEQFTILWKPYPLQGSGAPGTTVAGQSSIQRQSSIKWEGFSAKTNSALRQEMIRQLLQKLCISSELPDIWGASVELKYCSSSPIQLGWHTSPGRAWEDMWTRELTRMGVNFSQMFS